MSSKKHIFLLFKLMNQEPTFGIYQKKKKKTPQKPPACKHFSILYKHDIFAKDTLLFSIK